MPPKWAAFLPHVYQMSTKKCPQGAGAQWVVESAPSHVYQNVYHGHFWVRKALLSGPFFAFLETFKGLSGVSYAPNQSFQPLGRNVLMELVISGYRFVTAQSQNKKGGKST